MTMKASPALILCPLTMNCICKRSNLTALCHSAVSDGVSWSLRHGWTRVRQVRSRRGPPVLLPPSWRGRGGCACWWPKTEGSSVHHTYPDICSAECGDWNWNPSVFCGIRRTAQRKLLAALLLHFAPAVLLQGWSCRPLQEPSLTRKTKSQIVSSITKPVTPCTPLERLTLTNPTLGLRLGANLVLGLKLGANSSGLRL